MLGTQATYQGELLGNLTNPWLHRGLAVIADLLAHAGDLGRRIRRAITRRDWSRIVSTNLPDQILTFCSPCLTGVNHLPETFRSVIRYV